MKYRVIKDGFYVTDGIVPVGTEFSIDSDLPGGWKHFVEESGKSASKADPEAELIVNPAQEETPRRGRPRKDA